MPERPPAINLITNCTSRKRHVPAIEACLRSLATGNGGRRLSRWLSRLAKFKAGETHFPRDLYCGDGWSNIQKAVSKFQERSPLNFWIASAGYGLLSSEDKVAPYSATFSAGNEDSVATKQDPVGNQMWWLGLTNNRLNASRTKKSVSELARRFPNTPLLVGISSDYLWAMTPDLLAASELLSAPDLMVIVSAGTKKAGDLTPFLLPCNARLEHRMGGVRSSLNSRIIAYILNKFSAEEIRMSILRKHFENILKRAPEPRAYNRKKLSDKQIVAFIRKSLKSKPGASFSSLLRIFRDSDMACEYKRFRNLFHTVTP